MIKAILIDTNRCQRKELIPPHVHLYPANVGHVWEAVGAPVAYDGT